MIRCKCEVPGCEKEAEFEIPRFWCSEHWEMWFDWDDDKLEPEWMK